MEKIVTSQKRKFLSAKIHKNKLWIALYFILFFTLSSCATNFKTEITKYVAIGDSLTAGFQNGGLVEDYQKYSYPNIIAKQLGIKDFQQPLIFQPGIPPVLKLVGLNPLDFRRKNGFGYKKNPNPPRFHDNLGIPGATLYSALHPDDSESVGLNPFFNIVLGESGSIINQVLLLKPKLITFWLGHSEILSGVMKGKVIYGKTIFPPEKFAYYLDQTLEKLSVSGAKIVMANLFDVTQIPFVTALPIFIQDPFSGEIVLDEKGNPVPFIGPEGPMTEGWHITQAALGFVNLGYGIPVSYGGIEHPLSDEQTLSPIEISDLRELVSQYNRIIEDAAAKHGAVLVDIYCLFNRITKNGYIVGDIKYTIDFPNGGLISYDGIHPSTLGYAITANEFIKKINESFNYDIPLFPYEELIKEEGFFKIN
ncbi:hypothetical protein ES703_44786 [subsurface metagenome]